MLRSNTISLRLTDPALTSRVFFCAGYGHHRNYHDINKGKYMSGVIDEYGQWEHCNVCGKWVLIQNLGYVKPDADSPYGTDICVECAGKQIQAGEVQFDQVEPGAGWVTVYVKGEWHVFNNSR